MSMRSRASGAWLLTLLFVAVSVFVYSQEKPAAGQEGSSAYTMPGLFPYYSAPPVRFRDNRILTIVFKTAPGTLRELVPEPLLPNPADLMFVYFSSLNIENPAGGRFSYLEAGIGVPMVSTPAKALGNYALCLYLNKTLPIVAGREVWGWPKKDAEMRFEEKDGEIIGLVERSGSVLMNVSAKILNKIPAGMAPPQMPWFLQKIIPSVRKEAPPEVWQIVSLTNKDHVMRELWSCRADLELASGPEDPLGRIKVLSIVSAQFGVSDFVMDSGEILHNYLEKK